MLFDNFPFAAFGNHDSTSKLQLRRGTIVSMLRKHSLVSNSECIILFVIVFYCIHCGGQLSRPTKQPKPYQIKVNLTYKRAIRCHILPFVVGWCIWITTDHLARFLLPCEIRTSSWWHRKNRSSVLHWFIQTQTYINRDPFVRNTGLTAICPRLFITQMLFYLTSRIIRCV
jgi:hypothetical protein